MSYLSIIVIIILKLRKGKVKYFHILPFADICKRLKNIFSEERERKIHCTL